MKPGLLGANLRDPQLPSDSLVWIGTQVLDASSWLLGRLCYGVEHCRSRGLCPISCSVPDQLCGRGQVG